MKENRKLLKEVLKDIRHDMTDEEVLNLLADSKISVSPESGKEKYTLPINTEIETGLKECADSSREWDTKMERLLHLMR